MNCKHPSWKVRVYRDYDRGKGFYYIGCRCGMALFTGDSEWEQPSEGRITARSKRAKKKRAKKQDNMSTRQWACPWKCGGMISARDEYCPTCTGVI